MNETSRELSRKLAREIFTSACGEGMSKSPEALEQLIDGIRAGTTTASMSSLETLLHAVWKDYATGPFTQVDAMPDRPPGSEREASVRSVLTSLRSWTPSSQYADHELRALLTAINALDFEWAGIKEIAEYISSNTLIQGLLSLLDDAVILPWGGDEKRFPDVRQTLKATELRGNYSGLGATSQYLMPRASPELGVVIVLLWRVEPAGLGRAIAERDDIYFSLLVRNILGDRNAEFAVQVPLISFKYLSVENIEHAYRRGDTSQDWSTLLSRLLLQVAETPEWTGWMLALLRFPVDGSLVTLVMPKVLAELHRHHWSAFVDVLTLGYSQRAAKPVTDIMAKFAHEVGQEKASELWAICFERWSRWNYGKDEEQFYLFAPAACALDYPVAMHYARLVGPELDGEEGAVALAIETIEQQWFSSSSELITERNRLLSRLRLISHGRKLASGSADLLPPAVTPPDDLYTRVRYGFYDVNARGA